MLFSSVVEPPDRFLLRREALELIYRLHGSEMRKFLRRRAKSFAHTP
jgi:hypothetical protein